MSDQRGFTLLEILISIAITSMLLTAGFTAFRGIMRVQERARPEVNRAQTARVLLDRVESELLGTLLVVKRPAESRLRHPWLFVGEDRVFGTNDSDAIRFVTSNPARPPGAESETGVRMVTYAVGDEDGEERLALYRSERRLPRSMQKQIDLEGAARVLGDVAFLRLRYLGEDGWRERWDSTDVSQLDQLPEAIEITLQLWEPLPDGAPGSSGPGDTYTRTVPIPVRPLSQDGLTDTSCPDGVTVRGCMLRLANRLKRLGGAQRTQIQAQRQGTPDLCWNPETPSEQLAALKNLLGVALGRDPDEVCE